MDILIGVVLFAVGVMLGYEWGFKGAFNDFNNQQLQARNQELWMEMMNNITGGRKDEEG